MCVCVRARGEVRESFLCLEEVLKDLVPTKPPLLLRSKVPGGIVLSGRLASPAFHPLPFFLEPAHLLFSSFLLLPLHHWSQLEESLSGVSVREGPWRGRCAGPAPSRLLWLGLFPYVYSWLSTTVLTFAWEGTFHSLIENGPFCSSFSQGRIVQHNEVVSRSTFAGLMSSEIGRWTGNLILFLFLKLCLLVGIWQLQNPLVDLMICLNVCDITR